MSVKKSKVSPPRHEVIIPASFNDNAAKAQQAYQELRQRGFPNGNEGVLPIVTEAEFTERMANARKSGKKKK